jgi:hypothetical protein
MVSTIIEDEIEKPLLFKHKLGFVILVNGWNETLATGMVMFGGEHQSIGFYSENWQMKDLEIFNGEIKISNY